MWIAVIAGCLAVAMIVGPIMMMQPSPRQRVLGQLRTQASLKGIHVQLVANDQTRGHSSLASYSIPIHLPHENNSPSFRWSIAKKEFDHGAHFFHCWDWASGKNNCPLSDIWLREFLSALPETVTGVQQQDRQVSLFWNERWPKGQSLDDALGQIASCLQGLKNKLVETI